MLFGSLVGVPLEAKFSGIGVGWVTEGVVLVKRGEKAGIGIAEGSGETGAGILT